MRAVISSCSLITWHRTLYLFVRIHEYSHHEWYSKTFKIIITKFLNYPWPYKLIWLFFSFLLMLNWKGWSHPMLPFSLQFTHSLLPYHHPVCSVFTFKLRIPLKTASEVWKCILQVLLIPHFPTQFLYLLASADHSSLYIDLSRLYIKVDLYPKLAVPLAANQAWERYFDLAKSWGPQLWNGKWCLLNCQLKWPVYLARDQAVVAITTISRPFEGVHYKGKMKVQCYREAQINQRSKYIFKNFTSNSKKLVYLADISRIMTKLEGWNISVFQADLFSGKFIKMTDDLKFGISEYNQVS